MYADVVEETTVPAAEYSVDTRCDGQDTCGCGNHKALKRLARSRFDFDLRLDDVTLCKYSVRSDL